jgi:hypothetical protein
MLQEVGYSEFYYAILCLKEKMVTSVFNCTGFNISYLWKAQTFII